MTSLGIPRESRDPCAVKSQSQAQLSLFHEAKVIFDNNIDSYMHQSPKKRVENGKNLILAMC